MSTFCLTRTPDNSSGEQRGISLTPRIIVAVVALLLNVAAAARADSAATNTTGISAVWQMIYGARDIDPDADSDGDGLSNRQEAIAGTDPFDPQSAPRISLFVVTNKMAHVRILGAVGKRYELQASETICGQTGTTNLWLTQSSIVARTNPMVTLTAPAAAPARFFRVAISDVDSDGDGLTDWEEYQLGLDPFNAFSNGQVDEKGGPLNDYEYAMRRLNVQARTYGLGGAASQSSLFLYTPKDGGGTGLTGEYYTNSSAVYNDPVNFNPTNLVLITNNPVIDFHWGWGTFPPVLGAWWTIRWTGQVEPQFSETYIFETLTDDGCKLWVNDQLLIDKWQGQGATAFTNSINLLAGVRYNIRLEYFNGSGWAETHLFWYSPSQARQIIPASRLFPSSDGYAPGAVISSLSALGFVGQPFSYQIVGANSTLSYSATNLPPGLAVDSTNGIISGVPNLVGRFAITIGVSNVAGASTAELDLQVVDTGSSVTREVWTGVAGASITNIPVHSAATLTNSLGSLEGISNFGDNYGERVRGYVTAPATGNYYFWLAANNAAELWISNDDEAVNKVRRAYVMKPTGPRQWSAQPNQRSAWLSLQAGRRYYLEILHKAATGSGDHWSVGWLLDPAGTNTVPDGVVPGYVLSPFIEMPASTASGTLYAANLLAEPGVQSAGVGSATLRLSADESQAILKFSYSGLSSAVTGEHIHADTYAGKNPQGQIIFDIDAVTPQPDGSYIWQIAPSGTLSSADQVEIIKEGKAYLNVHTVNNPSGEISGHFGLAAGTATFTPPPPPPAWTDDHSNSNSAARFLQQATFGPTLPEIQNVKSLGYAGWLNRQFAMPPSSHLKTVLATVKANPNSGFSGPLTFNTWWQQSVTAPDQLRQRVAFALSEITVVSEQGVLDSNARALSSYYDMLLKDAFGNFRDLLRDVTLHPAMGIYLDMRRNDKGNIRLGTHPNENYAREILQLFSIGLNRMWPDGTLVLNSQGELVPTYGQNVIMGLAQVFTGWNYYQTNLPHNRLPTNWNPAPNYTNAMVLVPAHHDLGTKTVLDNAVLPAALGSASDPTNPEFDSYGPDDLEQALGSIFYNENVGPFICRQLIQRLVTSSPSRDYVYRVVQAFNNNGGGVRGDMKAVIRAILLDYEARSSRMLDDPGFGKQREPLLRATAVARAFAAPASVSASFHQNNTNVITITTGKPHRLNSGDDVFLAFNGAKAPASRTYQSVTVTTPTTFMVPAEGLATASYTQTGNTVTITGPHPFNPGDQLYLTITSGGARGGISTVVTTSGNSWFTVQASDSVSRSGECLYPVFGGILYEQAGTNITVFTPAPHCLSVGNNIYVPFPAGYPTPRGVYKVAHVTNPYQFEFRSPVSANSFVEGGILVPLCRAPAVRSGSVTLRYSTWNMGYTDLGYGLFQTPLHSPTVFNFFFPDYKFPGILAASSLTTPEFQLTSENTVVMQMNFFSSSLFNNWGNTNGLCSFIGGSGGIGLDLGPWMTPALTANAGIPALVDSLASLLCAGQISPETKQIIVGYVANPRFPFTGPTLPEMRDRVRAVAQLIVTSPEFAIQR